MDKQQYDQMKLVSSLMKIGHGDLSLYVESGIGAARHDHGLFGHFVAWNHKHSEVRDGKVAFPVIALRGGKYDEELAENATAHLCSLGPRELYRAILFNKELTKEGLPVTTGYGRWVKGAVKLYLTAQEKNRKRWDRSVVRSRKAMIGLYTISHYRPAPWAQEILFDHNYPDDSVFAAIRDLNTMSPLEAAGTVLNHQIPLPIAIGACPGIKDESVILALIQNASGTELINNTGMLKRLGVFKNSILQAAYNKAVGKIASDDRVGTLKAQRAAEHMTGKAKKVMQEVSEETIQKKGQIKGHWLILADKSGSMSRAIQVSKEIAGTVAKFASCDLVFFDNAAYGLEIEKGTTLTEIKNRTRRIGAGGATSIGAGLALTKNELYSGIVLVSDGGENRRPYFAHEYADYERMHGLSPALYMFRFPGDPDVISKHFPEMTVWDFGKDVDHVSLPNVVKTLRGSTFELLNEIFNTPLLTLKKVFRV